MPVNIQLRNVPDRLHRTLKSRAAGRGMSLSDYCLRELEQFASLPTWEDLDDRIDHLPPVATDANVVEGLEQDRSAR